MPKAVVAPKKERAAKKTGAKTIHPRRRSKSILVDVIEDEALPSERFLAEKEEDLAEASSQSAGDIKSRFVRTDLDRQKEFFNDLATEIKGKTKREDKAARAAGKRSLGLYRSLVLKFVILVAVLAVAVAYFSFSQLTVNISLAGETVNDSLLLKVYDSSLATSSAAAATSSLPADPRTPVPGGIKVVNAAVNKTYPASGQTSLGEEIVGQVRIINDYNKSQSLVATTRLLTPDGKLFRIKNAVNVPAGGETSVDIYADKPAAALAIGPSSFTIPGLWVGLQSKIYAKSDQPFVFTQKLKKYVTAADLEAAAQDIGQTLVDAAKSEAGAGPAWLYLTLTAPAVKISAKAGDQADEFTAQASSQIAAVAVDQAAALKLAEAKLSLVIPDDKELTGFSAADITYSLDSYDAASQTATVRASFSGTMILKSDAAVVDPKQLINLDADQIGTYLKSQPEIKDYQLKFFPSFIKKAPSLVDRIKIVVNE